MHDRITSKDLEQDTGGRMNQIAMARLSDAQILAHEKPGHALNGGIPQLLAQAITIEDAYERGDAGKLARAMAMGDLVNAINLRRSLANQIHEKIGTSQLEPVSHEQVGKNAIESARGNTVEQMPEERAL